MPAGPYMNCYGRVGACGYIPPQVRRETGADKLIQFDVASGTSVERACSDQPCSETSQCCADCAVRKADGFCVELTKPNEIGEAIFRLDKEYKGYTDPSASHRRVYRDVFEHGDLWFATGDLLKRYSQHAWRSLRC